MRALCNRVSHHAVQPDSGQNKRKHGEQGEQCQIQPLRCNRSSAYLLQRANIVNRLVWINFLNLPSRGSDHLARVKLRFDDDSHVGEGKLQIREIGLRPIRLYTQSVHLHTAHNTNDCQCGRPRVNGRQPNTFADRIFIRPIVPGKLFIDDDRVYSRRPPCTLIQAVQLPTRKMLPVVLLGEVASGSQWYAHGTEVIGTDQEGFQQWFLARWRLGAPLDDNWSPPTAGAER